MTTTQIVSSNGVTKGTIIHHVPASGGEMEKIVTDLKLQLSSIEAKILSVEGLAEKRDAIKGALAALTPSAETMAKINFTPKAPKAPRAKALKEVFFGATTTKPAAKRAGRKAKAASVNVSDDDVVAVITFLGNHGASSKREIAAGTNVADPALSLVLKAIKANGQAKTSGKGAGVKYKAK